MIEQRGPAAVADGLHELRRDVAGGIDEHGVASSRTDVDDDGGKLILTAGAPTITGNDEERMLLALRTIVDASRADPDADRREPRRGVRGRHRAVRTAARTR